MPRALHVSTHPTLDARQWPKRTAYALRDAADRGAAQLVCARLAGGVLSMGRHQHAADALTSHARSTRPVRRIGGGRAIALGEGTLAVALAVPNRSWLSDDGTSELAASKVLNRGVRGILGGLSRLGISAGYFGRDFLTVDSHQAGLLSFDIDTTDATIVECILAAEAHWWPPEGFLSAPPPAFGRGFPEPQAIERLAGKDARALSDVLATAYAERFGWTPEDAEAAAPPPDSDDEDARLVEPPPALPSRSQAREIPLGHLVARVRTDGGRLEDVSITGEFLADSAGLERLRREWRGVVPSFEEVGGVLNDVYSDPAHTLLGIPDLTDVAEAIVEAAGNAVEAAR